MPRAPPGGLRALGVAEDDSVALMLRNDFATFEVNMAAGQLGAYAVPINWHFTSEEAGYILADSGAKVLVIHADLLAQIASGNDCAVFGIPDEEFGEQICAHVEPLPGAPIDAMAVRSYLGQHLARYKVPKVVELRVTSVRRLRQDLQAQATRPVLGKGRAQHLRA
jgi:acyl-CoA synthetase (AMP-forming)/AMP-acid ligase II